MPRRFCLGRGERGRKVRDRESEKNIQYSYFIGRKTALQEILLNTYID